jgi:uncharacterized protein (DUF58 family)
MIFLIPSKRLLWLVVALILLAAGFAFVPEHTMILLIAMAVIAVVLLLDAIAVMVFAQGVVGARQAAPAWPVGTWQPVHLRIANRGRGKVNLLIHDHVPTSSQTKQMPAQMRLAVGQTGDLSYLAKITERGDHSFGDIEFRAISPLGLWERPRRLISETIAKVYPNFAGISAFALLATDNRLSQIGVLQRRRRGEGQDFHQLREYREGDSPRSIDWKASSKLRQLIAREYQDERNQQLMFLIDCGRRMGAKDDDLSHFDHALNSVLLLAYVAARQGDGAGLLTFSGEDERFVAPRRSATVVQTFLNTLYDVQTTLGTPDYMRVAERMSLRQPRRSLVILVTNLRDEDDESLLPAIRQLKRKHLVVLANLREQIVDELGQQQVTDFNSAVEYAQANDYLQRRRRSFARLAATGVIVLDVPPAKLAMALVNQYLELKRSAVL